MTYRISMEELGIAGDNTVFQGATPGDVWEQVAARLKDKHGITLPKVDDTLSGNEGGFIPPRFDNAIPGQPTPVTPTVVDLDSEESRGAALIATRLLEKLRMGQESASGKVTPPGETQSLVP